MRSAHAPLLQAHRGSPGSSSGSPYGLFKSRRQRAALVLCLGLLAAALLLLLQRDGGGGSDGTAAAGDDDTPHIDLSSIARDAEAAAAAVAAAGGGDVAAAELAAAQKRARKAAALPPPQFRSHAEGLTLSEGATEAAAACRGEHCERLVRFVLAAGEVGRLAEAGGCAVQHCPDALGVGARPLPYTPHAMGNRCEPLYNRGALEAVRQLAGPDWRGLEWGTGGSTAWFLARLAHLTSVEATPGFAAKARGAAEAQFDAASLAQRWQLRTLPPAGGVTTFADTESGQLWADYAAAAFLPDDARFDVISLTGYARMACLDRAVQLLRPQGGLLVLPQAQRAAYAGAEARVPRHWLRLTDEHAFGTTLVWMSRAEP